MTWDLPILGATFRAGVCLALSASAAAQGGREVFVSTGEHGEVSFSDVATPGAERRALPPVKVSDDAVAELERSIQQTLDVARALEESRLARERVRAEARAEARAAAQARAPVTIVEERYAPFPYVYAPYHEPWPPHHGPPHHPPAQPQEPGQPAEPSRGRPFVWRGD